jgi:hypothetical protein
MATATELAAVGRPFGFLRSTSDCLLPLPTWAISLLLALPAERPQAVIVLRLVPKGIDPLGYETGTTRLQTRGIVKGQSLGNSSRPSTTSLRCEATCLATLGSAIR